MVYCLASRYSYRHVGWHSPQCTVCYVCVQAVSHTHLPYFSSITSDKRLELRLFRAIDTG